MNDVAPVAMPLGLNAFAASMPPVLAIIVPSFNEKGNVAEVHRRVAATMGETPWELIFVDDNSPDGTADAVRTLAQDDARVRIVQRVGRRGLSSACVEGMMATAAPYVAVMDADLQHDETLLPAMLRAVRDEGADVAIGSRYVDGGSVGNWDASRSAISRMATRLGQRVMRVEVADPMSGFFLMRGETARACVPHLSAIGFKILLDMLASSRTPLRCRELPYTFRQRVAGESKLDSRVAWDYLMLLADKLVGHIVPVRFLAFALIGAVGVVVHLVTVALAFRAFGLSFVWAQTAATVAAMTFNFFLNNVITYRDSRLRGLGLVWGWLTFVAACSIGAAANVGIASYLFEQQTFWLLSAFAGILVGAVWNYAVTSVYTWRAR